VTDAEKTLRVTQAVNRSVDAGGEWVTVEH
jgi:hypothetical protein